MSEYNFKFKEAEVIAILCGFAQTLQGAMGDSETLPICVTTLSAAAAIIDAIEKNGTAAAKEAARATAIFASKYIFTHPPKKGGK